MKKYLDLYINLNYGVKLKAEIRKRLSDYILELTGLKEVANVQVGGTGSGMTNSEWGLSSG